MGFKYMLLKNMLALQILIAGYCVTALAQKGSNNSYFDIDALKHTMANEGWATYWDNPANKDEFMVKFKSGLVIQHITDITKNKIYRLYLLSYIIEARKGISIDDKALIYEQIYQLYLNKYDDSEIRSTAIVTLSCLLYDLRENNKIDANYINNTIKAILETIKSVNETKTVKISSLTAIKELFYTDASPELLHILQRYYSQNDIELSRVLAVILGDFKYTPAIPVLKEILEETKSEELFGSTAYSLGLFGRYECLVYLLNSIRRFPDNYSCDYTLNENRPIVLDLLNSGDEAKSTFALHASQYLFNQEELIPQYLNILKNGNIEQKRFLVERLVIINNKNGLVEAVKILETEKDHFIVDKLNDIIQSLNSINLEIKESDKKTPEQSKANLTTQEVADGMFRELSIVGLDPNFNHAAVYKGLNSASTHKIVEAGGAGYYIQEANLSTMTNNGSLQYFGSYNLNNRTLTFTNRQSIISTANQLVNANIPYVLPAYVRSLDYYDWASGSITVGEIARARCDGTLEYCYEYNGFNIWGQGSGRNYNISFSKAYCDSHNFWEGLTPFYQRGGAGNTNTYMTWAATTGSPAYTTPSQTYVSGGTQVSVTATDQGSGIFYIRFSLDGGSSFFTSPIQANYPASPSQTYICPTLITTSQWVYYYAKDNGGNFPTNWLSVYVTADNTAPTGSLSINSGATYTNTTNVTLTCSASDAQSGVAQMQFSNDGSSWSGWQTYSTSKNWTLNSGDGSKTVYVQYRDVVGNTSTYSDNIILDATAPSSGTISINNGAASTTTLIVALNSLYAYDALSLVYQMRFSNNNSTWSTWETYANIKTNWDLSSYGGTTSLGTKTTWVQYKDNAGNISSSFSDDINYVGSSSPILSVSTNSWAAPSGGGTSPSINVTNSGNSSVISYTVTKDSSWLTVSVASGNTPGSFTITASNNTSGVTRTGHVNVTAPGVQGSPQVITVTQGSSTQPILNVSTNSWAAPSGGGTSPSINVTNSGNSSVISYTVTKDSSWLTVSVASGNTPGSFTITASNNTSGVTRTGHVNVTAPGVQGSPQVITVTQGSSGGSAWYYIANIPDGGGSYTRWSYNGSCVSNNLLWLIGGRRDVAWTVINNVGTYNPTTNAWNDTKPILNQGRVYLCAAGNNQYVYALGGRNPAGDIIYNNVERLAADTGTSWYNRASLPAGRVFGTAVCYNGYIYYIGGTSDAGGTTPTTTFWRYDMSGNTWNQTLAQLPATLYQVDATIYNGKIYVLGDDINNSTYVYNIASNIWSTISNGTMPAASCYKAVTINDKIWRVGGISNGASTSAVWQFDPINSTWIDISKPMGQARINFSAGLIGNLVVAAGGVNWPGFTPTMTAEAIDVGWLLGVEELPTVQAPLVGFSLLPNHPNPVKNNTAIAFNLVKAGPYIIKIYNISGQQVDFWSGYGKAGLNNQYWNATKFVEGVYIYQLIADGQTATRKLVVIK